MKKMSIKKMYMVVLVFLMMAPFVLGNSSCSDQSPADRAQAQATKTMMAEAQREVGMPNIVNWQQRKLMKMIYELCDKEDLITYLYLKCDYTGKLIYYGKAIGYGIPFSAQFTNPEYLVHPAYDNSAKLAQPDPNGLYMPTSSSATWVMMIDPATNKPRPVYIEPEIVVSPFPLKVNVEYPPNFKP